MRSFKRIVISIVSLVIALIVSAISINTFYVAPIRSDIDTMNDDLKSVNESIIELDLSLSVIGSVTTQLSSKNDVSTDTKDMMITAYDENHKKALSEIAAAYKSVSDAVGKSRNIADRIMFADGMEIGEIRSELEAMKLKLGDFDKELRNIQTRVAYSDKLSSVKLVESQNKAMLNAFSAIDEQYSKMKGNLLSAYFIFVTLVFVFLLMIILMLSQIITKIMIKDVGYMSEALKMMSRFDFDISKLPEERPVFLEEKDINDMVVNIFKEQCFIKRVKDICGKGYILDDIINHLFDEIQSIIEIDRIGIAFVDNDTRSIIAEYGVSNYGNVLIGPGYEVGMETTTLTNIIGTKNPAIMHDINEELLKRPKSVSLNMLKREGITSNMIIPLISDESVFGFMFFASVEAGKFGEDDLQLALNISQELSTIIDKTYLTKKMFSTITRTFSSLVEKKDNETGDHISRMTAYSTVIAEELMNHKDERYRVSRVLLNDIENNAAVHDIGKVGIPDSILKKPGRLTDEEREAMKDHSAIGADIMSELRDSLKIFNKNFYQTSIDIARSHHEKWDGSGYPDGLSDFDIPLSARIVAVADVFDAVTSKRVYKDKVGFEESVEIINGSSGSHFDPEIVSAFNRGIDRIRKIYEMS